MPLRCIALVALSGIATACNLYSTNYDGQCHADKVRKDRATAICAIVTAERVGDPSLRQGDPQAQLSLVYYGCAGLLEIPDDNKTGKCDGHVWSYR